MQGNCSVLTAGPWGTDTTEANLALSLLHVSKALFHPMLDCVVFSLVISMQWAKATDVICLTYTELKGFW